MRVELLLEDEDDDVVAVAALLLELAHIDGDFSEEEAVVLIQLMGEHMARSLVQGKALLVRARSLLRRSQDLETLVKAINGRFDLGSRVAIVNMLWQVAFADDVVDRYENYLVNRLAKLLEVPLASVQNEKREALLAHRRRQRD
ncbi:MAG: TerB family tellurite resistance protein [Myxococcales bacterium]|nr:TerB family tellurite resistance protein [Myxococcales bacterium]MCB9692668.1 TerB family tellurite resistance protein [Alphaproteobacteria bacterium]